MRADLGVGPVIRPRQQHSAGPDKAAEVVYVVIRGPVLMHPLHSSASRFQVSCACVLGIRLLQECLAHHINRQCLHMVAESSRTLYAVLDIAQRIAADMVSQAAP